MKKYILLMCVAWLQTAYNEAFGQSDSRIATWVSTHPSVHIFSEANYNQLSSDFKSKLKDQVIVYKNKLTFDDLMAYDELEKSDVVSSQTVIKDKDAQIIKNWFVTHPDIKIIKQSEFQSMTEERRTMYQSAEALILNGEYITLEDIANYPH